MRKVIILPLVLALSACATGPSLTTAPAPLQQTVIDERTLLVAINGAEAIRAAVDALVAAKVIVPGTPRALQVRKALVTIRDGLNAAAAAQKAGSTDSYFTAIARANEAITTVRSVLNLN